MGYEGYISYDLGMIKPLSYYSGILFSGLVKDLGAPVLSGGRYDNLADAFGKHMPAVGFAMGLKRILVALERQGSLPEEKSRSSSWRRKDRKQGRTANLLPAPSAAKGYG